MTKENELLETLKQLKYAKENVLYLLENANACVDFHGLSYWATEVERLRSEIQKLL